MAPLSRSLLLLVVVTGVLLAATAVPTPVRVPVAGEEDDGLVGVDHLTDGEDGDDSNAEADSTGTRPVAILEHRQELQDDGTFNYAFSADNGLSQNEAFHPDGSRTGSYSYVDPKGETILVKYRADRFGFHVLDGSSIPSTMPHLATQQQMGAPRRSSPLSAPASDYGTHEQGVLDPSYFNYPGSGISDSPTFRPSARLSNLKAAATSKQPSKPSKTTTSKAAPTNGRARSSASSSMHFLQREAREAFISDGELDDGEESRMAMRKVRPPPGMKTAPSNELEAAPVEELNPDSNAPKHDDGSYEQHVTKYDDGSYNPHAAKYDDGSYETHAALYDDGSYERHAGNYDDGSYEPHAAKYDDGSYEAHAAKYDDGSYEKYARLYDNSGNQEEPSQHTQALQEAQEEPLF